MVPIPKLLCQSGHDVISFFSAEFMFSSVDILLRLSNMLTLTVVTINSVNNIYNFFPFDSVSGCYVAYALPKIPSIDSNRRSCREYLGT